MCKILFPIVLILSSSTGYSFISPPVHNTPTNNATISTFHLGFLVNTSTGATNYEFQYDTVSTFNSPHLRWDTSGTRSVSTKDLLKGKTYYWRARAFKTGDTSAWSSHFTFFVFTKFTLTSPTNASTGAIVPLICGYAGTVVNYIFEMDTVPTFNSVVKVMRTQTSRLFDDSTLFKFGRKIYWRATAINSFADTLDWADSRSYTFYTQPTINSTGGTADPLKVITWPSPGLSKVLIYVDTVVNFNSPGLYRKLLPVGAITDSLKDLLFGKKYYCRIMVIYNSDSSLWSAVSNFTVIVTGSPLTPPNGATILNLLVQLSWSTVKGTSLQLQVARDTFFNNIMFDSIFLSNNFNLRETLDLNTKYHWRIRYFHSFDTTMWTQRDFKTYTGQVSLNSPANNAINQNVSIQFQFNPLVWATGYVIEIDTGKVFTPAPSSYRITSGTFKNVSIYKAIDTLLRYGSNIVWRVYAIKGTDTAAASVSRTFSTMDRPIPYFPNNNFVGIGTQTNGLVTGIMGSDSIEWQLDTSYSFNSPELSTGKDKHKPDGINPPYILLNLPGDRLFHATYYWRSRCISAIDISQWSVIWKFLTTQDVWHNSPPDRAINVDLDTTLHWVIQGSVDDYNNQYQFGTDSTFGSVPIKTLIKGASQEAKVSCNYSTTYYWRARVFHNRDTSKWSIFTRFTTKAPPIVGKTELLAPLSGTTDVALPSVLLFWNELQNATNYEIQAAYDIDFNNLVTSTTVTGIGVRFSGLQTNKKYYWRVKAKIGIYEGPWSNVWWFETVKDVGINETTGNNEVLIFPNPVVDWLNIQTSRPVRIEIYNGQGQLVLSSEKNRTSFKQNISELPVGLYMVRLTGYEGTETHKFLINR